MAEWVVSMKKADFNGIGEKYGISPVLARIMRNRELQTDEEIRLFLQGTLKDLHAPEKMKDMEKAAGIMLDRILAGAKIRIIGDYDVDGVCSTYILQYGLESLGADVDAVIPHRIKDGYGLNVDLIEEAIEDGIDTIITCDNGIAAKEPIKRALEAGMTVVVTDHHEVPFIEEEGKRIYQVPEAHAVVDPKQEDCNYPFSGICGAVVAYKLIQCMYMLSHKHLSKPDGMLEFATLATICDVMELRDENRILVKEGLKAIAQSENIGLRALLEVCELAEKEVSVYHVGFVLGPCINATGRLDTAERGLELFRTSTYREAMMIASELKGLNESRKAMTLKGYEEALEIIQEEQLEKDYVLVVYLPDCHESLAGIIAGRLRERFHKPSIVLTKGESGLKGSGRSIDAYHMYEKLCEASAFLTKFGGHKLAAGLSLEEKNLEAFRRVLNENCGLSESDLEEKVTIDVPMPMAYVTEEFTKELSILEPFGTGNPKPVFAQKNLRFVSGRRLGTNATIGKYVTEDENGNRFEVMMFDQLVLFEEYIEEHFGKQELEALYGKGNANITLMITYYPDINEFRGRKTLQFIMKYYR